MTSLTHNRQHRVFGPLAEQFNDLLRRYPHVDHDEIEQMIAIYPKLTILEIGLLSADDGLGEAFQEFNRAYPERLKQSWRHHLLFGLVMLGSLGLPAALVWSLMA